MNFHSPEDERCAARASTFLFSPSAGFLGGSISDSGGPNKGVSGDYVSDLSSYFRRVTSNVTIHQGGIPGILNLHFVRGNCEEPDRNARSALIFKSPAARSPRPFPHPRRRAWSSTSVPRLTSFSCVAGLVKLPKRWRLQHGSRAFSPPNFPQIELAINDVMHQYKEGHGYHERLIRKALGYARRPATVELAFHTFQPEHLRRLRYLQTNADICGSVAEYYAQPMLAYRALLFDEVARGEMDPAAFMSRDLMHPDPVGHAYMVDAVVEMVRAEARALGSDEPWGPSDEAALERELAPPMFKNNDKISTGVVLLGEDMRRLVVENSTAGFDLRTVSPAFPHPATALHGQGQGSRLALDMRLDEVAAAAPIPFKAGWAFFGYLRDQSGQSRANVSCTNCYCPLYNLYPTQPGRFRQLFTSICMRSDPAGAWLTGLHDLVAGFAAVSVRLVADSAAVCVRLVPIMCPNRACQKWARLALASTCSSFLQGLCGSTSRWKTRPPRSTTGWTSLAFASLEAPSGPEPSRLVLTLHCSLHRPAAASSVVLLSKKLQCGCAGGTIKLRDHVEGGCISKKQTSCGVHDAHGHEIKPVVLGIFVYHGELDQAVFICEGRARRG